MKLFCLGNEKAPCVILKWNNTTIMLDCGLNIHPLLQFLPAKSIKQTREKKKPGEMNKDTKKVLHMLESDQLYIESTDMQVSCPDWELFDLSTVDVLLISNSFNMLALPYLMERTDFQGVAYATEPTIQIGLHMMKELVQLLEEQVSMLKLHTNVTPESWKNTNLLSNLPEDIQTQFEGAWRWESLYNLDEIMNAIEKVQPLNYHESKSIYSLVKVTPVSSGFCLGGANWIIETSHEKVTYVADTCNIQPRHPEILDYSAFGKSLSTENKKENLINNRIPDIIILSSTCISNHSESPSEELIPRALSHIGLTINNNGNVLIPTYSCGIIFDMFESIKNYLLQRMKRAPIFLISPVGKHSLAYANIIAEYLSKERQEKVYLPEAPFPHEEMITSKLLFHYNSMEELMESGNYREPCIVFAGHPSLRCGEAAKFLRMWGQQSTSSVLFLEPGIDYKKAIAPYKPLKIKTIPCPVDWRINHKDLATIISDVKPKQLIVPEVYNSKNTPIQTDIPSLSYGTSSVIPISLNRPFEHATISADLSKQLIPTPCGPVSLADFSASLSTFDNHYSFEQASLSDLHTIKLYRQRYICGSPSGAKLIESLRKEGIEPSSVKHTAEGRVTITYENPQAEITFSKKGTTINCADNTVRKLISSHLLSQCQDLSTK